MNTANNDKLNNPVWHSLNENHSNVSINYDGVKFYDPGYCPFGGIEMPLTATNGIAAYAKLITDFFIVGEKPVIPDNLVIKKELICLQMTIASKIKGAGEDDIVPLTSEFANDLHNLVNDVQPGYFRPNTPLLGSYFGLLKNGMLVAAAGERMKMNDFTEISAIVTHPNHTGKGYARQLIAHTVNNIFEQHKTPYLHVLETNIGAIKLYERLGFTTRRKISFWNIADKDF